MKTYSPSPHGPFAGPFLVGASVRQQGPPAATRANVGERVQGLDRWATWRLAKMARALVAIDGPKKIFPNGRTAFDVRTDAWLNVIAVQNANHKIGAPTVTTINIHAIECESNADAIQHADASGFGEAVTLEGKPMVVPQTDCDQLQAAGVEFAYLCDRETPDGSHRIMTVPIN